MRFEQLWITTDRFNVKKILKNFCFHYLQFCCYSLPKFTFSYMKKVIHFEIIANTKSRFRSQISIDFFCLLVCKHSRRLNNLKLNKLGIRKFQGLLFMLKRSFICCYMICIAVPLTNVNQKKRIFLQLLLQKLINALDSF